jgi:hypothetical protein
VQPRVNIEFLNKPDFNQTSKTPLFNTVSSIHDTQTQESVQSIPHQPEQHSKEEEAPLSSERKWQKALDKSKLNRSISLTEIEKILKHLRQRDTANNIASYKRQLIKIRKVNRTGNMPRNFLKDDWKEAQNIIESTDVKTTHRRLNLYLYNYLERLNMKQRVDEPTIPSTALEKMIDFESFRI